MILTFKYPVYPDEKQETVLLDWFEHLCDLQNSARLNRIRAYEEEGRSVSCYEQQKLLTEARAKHADFRAVPQDFQVSILKRSDKSFVGFFAA
jgi:hypothetical protein